MAIEATEPAARVDATEEDEKLVRVIEQYDAYLADQQQAFELLKQGFLTLTMAKMNLPAHTLGELSYKDEFDAALYVTEEDDGTLTIVRGGDSDSSSPSESLGEPSSSALKHRKNYQAGQKADSTATAASGSVSAFSIPNQEDAAIMWFSSLPPTNLRAAQKNFRSALHALLASAAEARKVQSQVVDLMHGMHQS